MRYSRQMDIDTALSEGSGRQGATDQVTKGRIARVSTAGFDDVDHVHQSPTGNSCGRAVTSVARRPDCTPTTGLITDAVADGWNLDGRGKRRWRARNGHFVMPIEPDAAGGTVTTCWQEPVGPTVGPLALDDANNWHRRANLCGRPGWARDGAAPSPGMGFKPATGAYGAPAFEVLDA